MTQEEVREIIREELSNLLRIDKFEFNKDIKIINGKNIQVGIGTGTKIGTSSNQKLGFFGKTPITRKSALNEPDTAAATYSQSNLQSAVDSVIAIINTLEDFGLVDEN